MARCKSDLGASCRRLKNDVRRRARQPETLVAGFLAGVGWGLLRRDPPRRRKSAVWTPVKILTKLLITPMLSHWMMDSSATPE